MIGLIKALTVIASVIIFVRFGVPRKKGLPKTGPRLYEDATLDRISVLAKSCTFVRRGNGIAFRSHKLVRLIKTCIKSEHKLEWEKAILENVDAFMSAVSIAVRAAASSYSLPSVNGYPRLYLFCSELVKCRQGDLSERVITAAVDRFSETAELTDRERELIYPMTALCILELVLCVASEAASKKSEFMRGISDGRAGRVDIDSLFDPHYVAGVCSIASEDDKNSLKSLLAENGVLSDTDFELLRDNGACAAIRASGRTLQSPHFNSAEQHSSVNYKSAVALSALISSVFSIWILIGVLASEYLGVALTLSVLLYVFIRVIFHKYAEGLCVLYAPFELISKAYKKDIRSIQSREPVIFGSGTDRSAVCSRTEYAKLSADNSGKIELYRRGCAVPDRLDVFVRTGKSGISLSRCGGAFYNGKAIYRDRTEDCEFSAELIPSPDIAGCCCRISVVNRKNEAVGASVFAAAMPMVYATDGDYTVKSVRGGAALLDDGKYSRAIFMSGARFGTDYTAALRGDMPCKEKGFAPTLVGGRELVIAPFSKSVVFVNFVYGSGRRELECAGRSDEDYFDFAAGATKKCDVSGYEAREFYDVSNDSTHTNYIDSPLEPLKYKISSRDGGFLSGGEYVIDNENAAAEYCNYSGRNIRMLFSPQNITEINFSGNNVRALPGEGLVIAALSERGVTNCLLGDRRGIKRTVYSPGAAQYITSFNGILTRLECFSDDKRACFVFDVANRTGSERELYLLFSFAAGEKGRAYGNKISFSHNGKSYILYCSQDINEYSLFKEGYYSRGRVSFSDGFEEGGSTPAQTMSGRLFLDAHASQKVAFYIVDGNNTVLGSNITARNTSAVRVITGTSLDILHRWSFYHALTVRIGDLNAHDGAIAICARKYLQGYDATKDFASLFSLQTEDGAAGGGELAIAAAVADYAVYSGYNSFLDKLAVFKGKRSSASIATHCALALQYAVKNHKYSDPASEICYCAALIQALRFFSGQKNCFLDADVCSEYIYNAAVRIRDSKKSLNSAAMPNKSDVYGMIIRAYAELLTDDPNTAYGVLKALDSTKLSGALTSRAVEPYSFFKLGAGKRRFIGNAVCSALFYLIVVEKLFGADIRGGEARFCPSLPENVGGELDIARRGGSIKVIVDGKGSGSDWHADKNGIIYGATTLFKLDNGAKITLFRDKE